QVGLAVPEEPEAFVIDLHTRESRIGTVGYGEIESQGYQRLGNGSVEPLEGQDAGTVLAAALLQDPQRLGAGAEATGALVDSSLYVAAREQCQRDLILAFVAQHAVERLGLQPLQQAVEVGTPQRQMVLRPQLWQRAQQRGAAVGTPGGQFRQFARFMRMQMEGLDTGVEQ